MTPVMLIGSAKSGTTTLHAYLIQHPEIAAGTAKELEYFSRVMGDPELKKGRYADLFQVDPNRHKFTLDASPGYTKFPAEKGVPERIKEYGLDPYFIYIVRDPLERIRSHYNFMKKDLNWKSRINSDHLINTSKYHTQLQEYEKVFPELKILVVEFDDLKDDPVKLCNAIFRFIGAHAFDIAQDGSSVKNKTVAVNRSKMIIQNRLMGYGKYFPSFLKQGFRWLLNATLLDKQQYLSNKVKQDIKRKLADDMRRFKEVYGIDTRKWGF